MIEFKIVGINSLKPNPRNARTHSNAQLNQIAESLKKFKFLAPIIADEKRIILAGYGRWEGAIRAGFHEVPVIVVTGLSEAKKRAYALADNQIAQNSKWDREKLAVEFAELPELLELEGLDLNITGFAPPEIDSVMLDFEENASDPADNFDVDSSASPTTIAGDLWQLGHHRLLCGDAREKKDLSRLMTRHKAAMAFLDPPYNVKVKAIVGRGKIKHREFAMGSGEMPSTKFVKFLESSLEVAAHFSKNGAVHFVATDWRHIDELLEASSAAYADHLNLVVWVKNNAGQGSFYRSQHELFGVFKVGDKPHLNNVELGRHGRNRSNVWQYAGVNSFRAGRMEDLAAHPTVKPVSLVTDAIKDVTRRDEVVLDSFCGSGTTILAAERVGRRAFAIEIEPRFVDVAIRRWQAFTGRDAIHAETGMTFDDVARKRLNDDV